MSGFITLDSSSIMARPLQAHIQVPSSSSPHSQDLSISKHIVQTLQQLQREAPEGKPLPISNQLLTKTTNKIGFHFLSDYWGKDRKDEKKKELEGSTHAEMLSFFATMTSHISKLFKSYANLATAYEQAEIIAHKISSCKNPTELDTYVNNEFKSQIQSLKEGQSVFIPAGWEGLPENLLYVLHTGHAMMVEVVKQDGNYSIRLLNTGGGLEYHIQQQDGYKTKFAPYLEWENIPLDKISDPLFWKSFFEPNLVPNWYPSERPAYNQDNIYWQFQQFFGVPKDQSATSIEKYISGQRAGTCPKKAGDNIARMLEAPDAYKRFKILSKLVTAEHLFHKWMDRQDALHHDANAYEILQKGLEKIEGSILKALNEGHYQTALEEKELVIGALHSLVFRFEAATIQFKRELAAKPSESYQALLTSDFTLSTPPVERTRTFDLWLQKNDSTVCGIKMELPPLRMTPLHFPQTVEEVAHYIDQLKIAAEQFKTRFIQPNAHVTLIHATIFEQLPLPAALNNPWDLFTPKQGIECLDYLNELVYHCYCEGLTNQKQFHPEQQLQFWKIYRIGIDLASKDEPSLQGQFHWSYFQEMVEDSGLTTLSFSMHSMMQELRESFLAHSPNGQNPFGQNRKDLQSIPFFDYSFMDPNPRVAFKSNRLLEIPEFKSLYAQVKSPQLSRVDVQTWQDDRTNAPKFLPYYLLRDISEMCKRMSWREIPTNEVASRHLAEGIKDLAGFMGPPMHPLFNFKFNHKIDQLTNDKSVQDLPVKRADWMNKLIKSQQTTLKPFMMSLVHKHQKEQAEIVKQVSNETPTSDLTKQDSYEFHSISEDKSELSIHLLLEKFEKEADSMSSSEGRIYFRDHLCNGKNLLAQVSAEPYLVDRILHFLEQTLIKSEAGALTNSANNAGLQRFLTTFHILTILDSLIDGLDENQFHKEKKNVKSLYRHFLEKIGLFLSQNSQLLMEAGNEQSLSKLATYFLASFPRSDVPSQIFLEALKIYGSYPIRFDEKNPARVAEENPHICVNAARSIARMAPEIAKMMRDESGRKQFLTLFLPTEFAEKLIPAKVVSSNSIPNDQLPDNDIWVESPALYQIQISSGPLIRIDILSGTVQINGIDQVLYSLPSAIKTYPIFSPFNSIKELKFHQKGNQFSPMDSNLERLSFVGGPSPYAILTLADGAIYQLVNSTNGDAFINYHLKLAKPFGSGLTAWSAKDKGTQNPYLLCYHTPAGMPIPAYVLNVQKKVSPIGSPELTLIENFKDHKALELFANFQVDMEEVLAWIGKDHLLKRVDIPLSYKNKSWISFVSENNEWVLDDSDSLKVSEMQNLSSLQGHPSSIILKNKSETFALVQTVSYKKKKAPPLSARKTKSVDTIPQPLNEQSSFILYKVGPTGELIAQSGKEKLYLAYIRLMQDDYPAALKLIQSSEVSDARYSFEELEILGLIIDSQEARPDSHPGASAVRISALWHGHSSFRRFPPPSNQQQVLMTQSEKIVFEDWRAGGHENSLELGAKYQAALESNYRNYLSHSLPSIRWSLDQYIPEIREIFLAKMLGEFEFDRIYSLLLSKAKIEVENLPDRVVHSYTPWDGSNLFAVAKQSGSLEELDQALFSHQSWGGKEFITLFIHAYSIASDQSQNPKMLAKKTRLQTLLSQRIMEDEKRGLKKKSDCHHLPGVNSHLYDILKNVLQNPEQFPNLPDKNLPPNERSLAEENFCNALSELISTSKNSRAHELTNAFALPPRTLFTTKRIGGHEPSVEYYNQMENTLESYVNAFDPTTHTKEKWLQDLEKLKNLADADIKELMLAIKSLQITKNSTTDDIKKEKLYRADVLTNMEVKKRIPDLNNRFEEIDHYARMVSKTSPYPAKFYEPQFRSPTHPQNTLSVVIPTPLNETFLGVATKDSTSKKDKPIIELVSEEEKQMFTEEQTAAVEEIEGYLQAFATQDRFNFSMNENLVQQTGNQLLEKAKQLQTLCNDLEGTIIEMANRLPIGMHQDEKLSTLVGRLKGSERAFDMPYCIGLLLQYPRNPTDPWIGMKGLSSAEQAELRQQLIQFLVYKTEQQHCQRIRDELSFTSGKEKKKALEDAAEMIFSKRGYVDENGALATFADPNLSAALLVLEYYADIRLYPEQVPVIESLSHIHLDPVIKDRVVQLIMGGGKTKVITPILALLAADGKSISSITATDQLYGTCRIDWAERLESLFGRYCDPLEFKREKCDAFHLQMLEETLERAQREGRILISRPNDRLALELMVPERCEQIYQLKNRWQSQCESWIKKHLAESPESKKVLDYLLDWKTIPQFQPVSAPKSKSRLVDDEEEKSSSSPIAMKKFSTLSEKLNEQIEGIKIHQASAASDIELYRADIDRLNAITKLLNEKQVNITDEFDSVSNPLNQLSFPVGLPISFTPIAIAEGVHLYFELLPQIEHLVHIAENKQTAYQTPESKAAIQKFLFDTIWKRFGQALTTLGVNEAVFFDYLRDIETNDSLQLDKLFTNLKTKKEYTLLCEQISFYKHACTDELWTALESIGHIHYGKSEKESSLDIVVPFEQGVPKEGSRFRSPFETLFKTCQFYRQEWKSPDLTQQIVETCLTDRQNYDAEPQFSKDLKSVLGEERFTQLNPENKDQMIFVTKRLDEAIKAPQNPEPFFAALRLIGSFLKSRTFPQQLVLDPIQITGTPLDYKDCPASNKCFTGTFGYHSTWDTSIDKVQDLATDGETIATLLRPENSKCEVILGKTLKDKVADCLANSSSITSALIDAGTHFRGHSQAEIAQEFLKQLHTIGKKAFLCYERNSQGQWVLNLWKFGAQFPTVIQGSNPKNIRKACGEIKPSEVFSFYDYAHIIGSDLPQPGFAEAIVTMGDKTSTDQILQAVMRMRQLKKRTQTIKFLVPEEVSKCITMALGLPPEQSLKSSDLIFYSKLSTRTVEKIRNFQGIRRQMQHVVKRALRKLLVTAKTPVERELIYAFGRQYFSSEQTTLLFEQFGHVNKNWKPWDLLEHDAKNILAKVNVLGKPEQLDSGNIEKEIKKILELHKKAQTPMPQWVKEKDLNANASMEIQSQAQLKVHQKMKQEEVEEKMFEGIREKIETPWPEDLSDPKLFFSLEKMSKKANQPTIHILLDAIPDEMMLLGDSPFSTNLCISDNLMHAFETKGNTFLGDMGKPVHHALVVEDPGKEPQLILLSTKESGSFAKALQKNPELKSRKLTLVEPHGVPIQHSKKAPWINPFTTPTAENKPLRMLLIQSMVVKGDLRRLKLDPYYQDFKTWHQTLTEENKVFLKPFLIQVLKLRESDQVAYKKSARLQSILSI